MESKWSQIMEWTNTFPEDEKLLLSWILWKAVTQESEGDPLKVSFHEEEAFELFGWDNSEESHERLKEMVLSISRKSIWVNE